MEGHVGCGVGELYSQADPFVGILLPMNPLSATIPCSTPSYHSFQNNLAISAYLLESPQMDADYFGSILCSPTNSE